MFEETLPKNARETLAVLGKSGLLKEAYLVGGTALALRIGHRISVDFDFFTSKKFSEGMLARRLADLPIKFQLEKLDWRTILGYAGRTRFSLFFYDYPWLEKPNQLYGVKIAGIKDIAAMKMAAVSDRGLKRDFIDLYFIIFVEKFMSLGEALDLYEKKFKVLRPNLTHILKSLEYFEDAENSEMPQMIKKVEWRKVKSFFGEETKFLAKKFFGI